MADQVIAESRNVRFGSNGYYDLTLTQTGQAAFRVDVGHSIFFEFAPNEADRDIDWSEDEREFFRGEWLRQIAETWNAGPRFTHAQQDISIQFLSDVRDQPDDTQWQIRVFKLRSSSSSRQSSVYRNRFPGSFDAALDSNDWRFKRIGNGTQTGLIHEFGHMIGLADEYQRSSRHRSDRASVMNQGSTVRERHLAQIVSWAKVHIDRHIGGAGMDEGDAALPVFLREAAAPNAVAELEAVEDWKEMLGPDDVVLFDFRDADTGLPIAVDQVDPANYDTIEVVFERVPGGNAAPYIWRPLSAEALEALLSGG